MSMCPSLGRSFNSMQSEEYSASAMYADAWI